ncbi:MAG TPA: hemerythrin domain-containing protein [Polyangiaceae bacterium]|nr:hemerythrin domain-containing protein [Polyangiaceae bacterium]
MVESSSFELGAELAHARGDPSPSAERGDARASRARGEPEVLLLLLEQHQRFDKLLAVLEAEVIALGRGDDPDFDLLRDVFFYMTRFPDRVHHPLEDLAFEKLAERAPDLRPRCVELHRQHQDLAARGAAFSQRLEDALRGRRIVRRDAIEQPAREYVELFRGHMDAEERQVFPACRQHLTAADWDELRDRVQSEDDPLFGGRVQATYQRLHRQIVRAADCDCAVG